MAAAVLLLLAACNGSDGDDDPLGLGTDGGSSGSADGSTDGMGTAAVDRQAILGSLAEVREMLVDAASDFDAQAITDVEYEDDRLTVTASEGVQGLDEGQALCQDLAQAVEAADLTVIVRDGSGAELAACTFRG